ncbi:MAG TPA: flagellar motor switch phosphatase FliY, partial [Tissierellaceae bacterium]|nr:flagellar motor switch phosphatase FliY [Tissierellaceae bacterium]
ATTLSSILNHKVLITTPRVSIVTFEQIVEECSIPKVVANVEFKSGITGNNFLMVDVPDAAIIADLMMGGNGENAKEELTELELSAIAEAMNQMIGSASTSMATMIGEQVDINPPEISLWDREDNLETGLIDTEDYICRIAFNLTVEGLIESEIMQIFTLEAVHNISKVMLGQSEEDKQAELDDTSSSQEEKVEYMEESKDVGGLGQTEESREEKIELKRPEFPPLSPSSDQERPPRNLDLIMDVPLEFSVVLGKSRKTIKEVLSLSNGSIVELNKLADEPLEIYVNGKLIAEGEVVVINENFGIRITNILSKEQRVNNLK